MRPFCRNDACSGAESHPVSLGTGTIRRMHFTPHRDQQRPCWHCTRNLGLVYQGSAARCALGGVRAMLQSGCAFWAREVGADDEPERVPSLCVQAGPGLTVTRAV